MPEQGSPGQVRPAFTSATARDEFFAAYAAVLAQWPVAAGCRDVPSDFGLTHVHVAGPADAPPLLLLHGGGATSTVWFNNIAALAENHRVYAVDQIGDAGRSVHEGRPLHDSADLMAWLDSLLDGLDLPVTALAGHSYGAWLALSYTLHAPRRIRRLVLLDPTDCLVGMPLAYLIRAVPQFVRPGAQAIRSFFRWETDGAPLDPAWLHLAALGGEVRTTKVVLPRRPSEDRLRTLTNPTLVLLGERSRALDARKAALAAERLLPDASVSIVPGQSHHTMPTHDADAINSAIVTHLR
ncbi:MULTISPECIES: alpha/beta fold hydrolase [Pseudonocardia]|uniref:Carboxylesterase YbfK n=2 Tax=Pseudonocardia TaxID=1847 RepID=A0A1Y2N9I5_PSEAH|nr:MULTISPECIES: alpha/beta hydrolase [Pseudonocardia]OSY44135.1 Carboxylesterase YbfK [Pseudonocardia autotrophica]TDN74135.1 pimeloyl-ACP methyl ester carboxylesterase [Pseudonocardia autotrophica]BBG04894.1 carboxylesterase [Pseudonocardia autotrophica]GEC23550.1 carboxylesterase [Pseudonocardia saturnea]